MRTNENPHPPSFAPYARARVDEQAAAAGTASETAVIESLASGQTVIPYHMSISCAGRESGGESLVVGVADGESPGVNATAHHPRRANKVTYLRRRHHVQAQANGKGNHGEDRDAVGQRVGRGALPALSTVCVCVCV